MSANGWAGSWAASTRWAAPRAFTSATRLSMEDLGRNARDFVLDGDWMPDYLATKYADVTDELLDEVEARARRLGRRRLWAHSRATATAAIFCGPTWGRTSSISTIA